MKKLFLILISFLLPLQVYGFEFEATVTEVKDGDSFNILDDGYFYRVRLVNIDAPEKGQPYSKRAKEFTSKLINHKVVRIKTYGQDHYGRLLAEVYINDKNLSRELIKAGLAWEYEKHSEDPKLQTLQSEARVAKKGIWSEGNPTPPWEYRKKKRLKN